MQVQPHRVYATDADEAAAKAWKRHAGAAAIVVRYLYVGWWECLVFTEVAR